MAFAYAFRVRYAETDQMGVVYHANYLTWFEIARTEFIRSLGFEYRQVEEMGVMLPVAEVQCKYFAPAHYDDLVEVRLEVLELGAATIRFLYEVVRPSDSKVLVRGWTRQAFVNREMRPVNGKRACPDIWEALQQQVVPQN